MESLSNHKELRYGKDVPNAYLHGSFQGVPRGGRMTVSSSCIPLTAQARAKPMRWAGAFSDFSIRLPTGGETGG